MVVTNDNSESKKGKWWTPMMFITYCMNPKYEPRMWIFLYVYTHTVVAYIMLFHLCTWQRTAIRPAIYAKKINMNAGKKWTEWKWELNHREEWRKQKEQIFHFWFKKSPYRKKAYADWGWNETKTKGRKQIKTFMKKEIV